MFCCVIIIISSRTRFEQQTESLMIWILASMHLFMRAMIAMIMVIIVIMSMMMMTMLTINIIKDDTA